ncbi:hypothetical protein WJX73_003340 [Symbiochloris irregularis]|uniref:Acyl carrier protein n=1 Tax=Symbiochloris irregularis TaxID=706552 RepID=A0AAW1P3L7_9CHLO
MALARCLSELRGSLLTRLRIPPSTSLESCGPPVAQNWLRGFAGSTYLDKNEVTERILSVIKKHDKVEQSKVSPSAHFQKDLGLDSLDTVEVVMALEEEFAVTIPDAEADKILSTEEAISYLSSHPQAK